MRCEATPLAPARETRLWPTLPAKLGNRTERHEFDSLVLEGGGRAFQPVHDGDDLLDRCTVGAHGFHGLHDGAAFGSDVLDEDHIAVGAEVAVDLLLCAVVLGFLAHHEPVDPALLETAHAHGGGD